VSIYFVSVGNAYLLNPIGPRRRKIKGHITSEGSKSLRVILVGETSGLLLDVDDAGHGKDAFQLVPRFAVGVEGDLKGIRMFFLLVIYRGAK